MLKRAIFQHSDNFLWSLYRLMSWRTIFIYWFNSSLASIPLKNFWLGSLIFIPIRSNRRLYGCVSTLKLAAAGMRQNGERGSTRALDLLWASLRIWVRIVIISSSRKGMSFGVHSFLLSPFSFALLSISASFILLFAIDWQVLLNDTLETRRKCRRCNTERFEKCSFIIIFNIVVLSYWNQIDLSFNPLKPPMKPPMKQIFQWTFLDATDFRIAL